jgi:MSHA biogenesis protein MshJ
MKQVFLAWTAKLDALSLRERAMVFAALAALIVFVLYTFLLSPLFVKQQALTKQVSQNQNNISGIDDEITRKIDSFVLDPDVAGRARLAEAKLEVAKLSDSLRAMQNGLVAPERIGPLLEKILRANGRLKLVALTTLPVVPMNEGSFAPVPAPMPPVSPEVAAGQAPIPPVQNTAPPPKPTNLLFRHGVELSMRGNYLDMVNYMNALEGMPTQLFWGKATLSVEEYPNAQLTLTLYTLSLDQKWMKL